LEFAAAEGCVPYDGEIYKMLYHDAKTVEDAPPALKLDCAAVDAKCPSFSYSNVGGDKCDSRPPNLLDDIRHHSIGGDKFFRVELSDYNLTVQNACLKLRTGSVADHVNNWGAVRDTLRGTRYEKYLPQPIDPIIDPSNPRLPL
jgi:hypothetical protein